MDRKLAMVKRVKEIRLIPGADLIELAIVDGWQCVVKKGEFSVGNCGVYMEVDSFLPEKPQYEFLRKSSFKVMSDGTPGFRLKTMHMRGQLSQGLLLPLDKAGIDNAEEGTDVTEALGIRKYEPPVPACLTGNVKGPVPGRICKTDQERIQNLLNYFEMFKELYFEETEKIDGTSMTCYVIDDSFGVCGHQWDFQEDDKNTYWRAARLFELENRLRSTDRNLALQMELIGEGIQKNKYMIKGHAVKIFDVWDVDAQRYMTRDERLEILNKMGLSVEYRVPETRPPYQVFREFGSLEPLLEYADGASKLTGRRREGLVFKSLARPTGSTVSFKVINNSFLLKDED
jgi:RNA ligase (TIGR02306 family)